MLRTRVLDTWQELCIIGISPYGARGYTYVSRVVYALYQLCLIVREFTNELPSSD